MKYNEGRVRIAAPPMASVAVRKVPLPVPVQPRVPFLGLRGPRGQPRPRGAAQPRVKLEPRRDLGTNPIATLENSY